MIFCRLKAWSSADVTFLYTVTNTNTENGIFGLAFYYSHMENNIKIGERQKV